MACHLLLSPRWAVTGMAAAYTLSYAIGLLLTALQLRQRTEGLLDGRRTCRTYARLTAAATGAGSAGWLIAHSRSHSLASVSWTPALSLTAGGITMLLLFLLLARLLRIGELRGLPGLG
ncbi:polysaccharide biosynthesis C-terminal domain-containing protein [Streptomyces hygroscopicus]|uniref:polysaccharide biosynthesis C-terminal domain-containing protein n=1 Tax=Streptomyces hygroscopicus TaxID=1912 RepID=UPI0004C6D478